MRRRTFLHGTAAGAAWLALQGRAFAKILPPPPAEPLLDPWATKYATPPFDKITQAALEPALVKARDLYRAEVIALSTAKDAPTFANTVAALDNVGRAHARVVAVFDIYTSTLNDKAMQASQKAQAPTRASFEDELVQNEALFARIKTVRNQRIKRPDDEQRLVELTYRNFARYGAALGKPEKQRLAQINKTLATLYTTFSQNLLADEEGQTVEGVKNTRSAVEAFLTTSPDRKKREAVWKMFISRGESAAHDNRPVITEILQLRAEKAKLLGFPTFAHWVLDDRMAKKPETAMALMTSIWKAATARVREEVADMQTLVDKERGGFKIAPWDYRYYAEKVRKAKFDLDDNEVKQYLQLDKLREGMFWAAGQLYGLTFAAAKDAPVYHPDVTAYEVLRDGKRLGMWFFDPFAREGKRSGAWMDEWRAQETYWGAVTPIVCNCANFVKPAKPGAPVLISLEDARTLFHEFGHSLHGLSSNVRFPSLAGTRVLRDFVEFPSQLNERWLTTTPILEKFCLHATTGKPMPQALRDKIAKARTFNSGFKTVENLACAIYDLEIHLSPSSNGAKIDPIAFEAALLKKLDCPTEIVMRHRPTQFGHVFSGDGYSAGYYSYMWADTLTADAAEAFTATKDGFYDKATAKRLYESITSVGGSIPPDEAFRRFRGRDVDTAALMRDRGFAK